MTVNPSTQACPAEQWTSLASNITSARFTMLLPVAAYAMTYVLTGDPAPALPGPGIGERIRCLNFGVETTDPVDVYVYVYKGGPDGLIVRYL